MISIYDPEFFEEIIHRIGKLTVNSQAQWGKMNVAQMLAHCNRPIEVALNKEKISRAWIGYFIGKILKRDIYSARPYKKGLPTHHSFVMVGAKEFEKEKNTVIENLRKFYRAGEQGAPTEPHPFYGKLTPDEWGMLQYKHFNHHLTQFGV